MSSGPFSVWVIIGLVGRAGFMADLLGDDQFGSAQPALNLPEVRVNDKRVTVFIDQRFA